MGVEGRENFGSDPKFFIGTEVEHTPLLGKKTLFVIGRQNPKEILARCLNNKIDHAYLGCGYTFEPGEDRDIWDEWNYIISELLKADIWVTLDYDVKYHETVLELGWNENRKFVSMLCVRLPYIEQLNYNATIKIDDKAFKATNQGVWCHSVHNLKDRNVFSDWSVYVGDTVIE